jgi:hypothetical protein
MSKPPFFEVWNRVVAHAGEVFNTKTGLTFTYRVVGDRFLPSRTRYQVARYDFEDAYRLVPLSGPGQINNIVRGPAYVWAVLHDARISRGAW